MTTIIYTPEEEIKFKNELKDLVTNYPRVFAKMLTDNSRKYLLDFINNKTPLLQAPCYKVSTKIYWLLNNLTAFPTCRYCGKTLDKINVIITVGYRPFCSIACSSKDKTVREKYKNTCLNRFGVQNPSQADCVKRKKRNTTLQTYGVDSPGKSEVIKQKIRTTCLKKYGVDSVFKTNSFKASAKATIKQKYGVEHQCQSDSVKRKITTTHLKRYGVKYPMQSAIIQQKIKATMVKRYGVENSMQNTSIRRSASKKYQYKSIMFDSAPELALYIYLKDHNIPFTYQPKTDFCYTFNNKQHKYMPDFKINDRYVEIKGNHLLDKETNTWVNPWNSDLNELYEAKHQCCLDNNVKILYTNTYMSYVNYVNDKYGKDYLKKFKTAEG